MSAIDASVRHTLYPARGELMKVGQVWVIESLQEKDCHAGRWIREHLEDSFLARNLAIQVTFRTVAGAAELLACLDELRESVRRTRRYPILDIECHGLTDCSGLYLSDGSALAWDTLEPRLQAINLASRFNLFLIMAACNGGYFGQTARLEELSSVCALLGPNNAVDDRKLLEALKAFYSGLFSTGDATEAINQLRIAVPDFPYFYTTAEGLFRLGGEGYLQDDGTPAGLQKRAERLIWQLRFDGNEHVPTVKKMSEELKRQERPYFNQCRRIDDTFNLGDNLPAINTLPGVGKPLPGPIHLRLVGLNLHEHGVRKPRQFAAMVPAKLSGRNANLPPANPSDYIGFDILHPRRVSD